ncbi:MAG: HAD-IB family phosphatase [Candidatus Aenigmatarchaeota archaeon]
MIVCFDFDDVICDGNPLYKIGKDFPDKFSELVDIVEFLESNKNPKKFYSVIKKIIALGKGITFSDVENIVLSFNLMEGVEETFSELKKRGYKIVIISADDKNIIENFMKKHDLMKYVDHIYASRLGVVNGELDGTITGDVIETEKTGIVDVLEELYEIELKDIFYIGDGLTDLPILKIVEKGVLFCPNMLTQAEIFTDDELKKKIDCKNLFIVEKKDLREVLKFID